MIKLNIFKDKKFGLLGLGKSGLASLEAIENNNLEYIWFDDNPKKIFESGKQEFFRDIFHQDWQDIDILIVSPGINFSTHPLSKVKFFKQPKITCDIEILYLARKEAVFIAITGTNGKSTTISLVNHILSNAGLVSEEGGNIGVPALSMSDSTQYYVLELSSYQLELIHEAKFDYSILLNITPDHLDRHITLYNYIKAKCKIFLGHGENDNLIINLDNKESRRIYKKISNIYPGKLLSFSLQDEETDVYIKDEKLYDKIFDNKSYEIKPNKYLSGNHNKENIAASYLVSRSLNIEPGKIFQAISSFKALPHRCEYVAEINKIKVINDSKATNSDATYHALNSYKNIYWIVGGLAKHGGIDNLIGFFPQITKAYLVGTAKYEFSKLMSEHKLDNIICENLEIATNFALKDANSCNNEGVVLLSPSCSSLDEWVNFEARGEAFKNYVFNWKRNFFSKKYDIR